VSQERGHPESTHVPLPSEASNPIPAKNPHTHWPLGSPSQAPDSIRQLEPSDKLGVAAVLVTRWEWDGAMRVRVEPPP
jgi:hypothetical protein